MIILESPKSMEMREEDMEVREEALHIRFRLVQYFYYVMRFL